MLSQKNLNYLVYLAQEDNDTNAINKLWDHYFPIIKKIIMINVVKFEVESYFEDLVNDSYILFCDGVYNSDLRNYTFSQYIKRHIETEMPKLIINKYLANALYDNEF